jgi:hypothetical protein
MKLPREIRWGSVRIFVTPKGRGPYRCPHVKMRAKVGDDRLYLLYPASVWLCPDCQETHEREILDEEMF